MRITNRRTCLQIALGVGIAWAAAIVAIGGLVASGNIGGPFLFDASNRYDLYVVNLAQGEEHKIGVAHDILGNEAWSPDGTQIAYGKYTLGDMGIMIQKVDADGKPIGSATKVASKTADSLSKIMWSPDGKSIAYLVGDYDGVGGRYSAHLFVVDLDSQAEKQITEMDIREASWSPDGKWFAIVEWKDTDKGSLYIVDAQTGEETNFSDAGDYVSPLWSPDSQWLVFTKNRASYRVGYDGGNLDTISLQRPFWVDTSWSLDGSVILYTIERSDDIRIMALNVETNERWMAIPEDENEQLCPNWSADGQTIYYVIRSRDLSVEFASLSLGGSEPETFFEIPELRDCPGWSPDRSLVSYYKHARGSDPSE